MNNFLELCEKRQSCRSFDETKSVEHEKLVKMVEAARLAPSACNSQPWSFVVIETPELVAEVASACQQLGFNKFTKNANAFILIQEEPAKLLEAAAKLCGSQYYAQHDMGTAVVTLCYEAAEQGLGTCIMGMYDREKMAELLKIPATKRLGLMLAVGYPKSEGAREKKRKSIEEIARFV